MADMKGVSKAFLSGLPDGFEKLLDKMIASVIVRQPCNTIEHMAEYLDDLIEKRTLQPKPSLPCPSYTGNRGLRLRSPGARNAKGGKKSLCPSHKTQNNKKRTAKQPKVEECCRQDQQVQKIEKEHLHEQPMNSKTKTSCVSKARTGISRKVRETWMESIVCGNQTNQHETLRDIVRTVTDLNEQIILLEDLIRENGRCLRRATINDLFEKHSTLHDSLVTQLAKLQETVQDRKTVTVERKTKSWPPCSQKTEVMGECSFEYIQDSKECIQDNKESVSNMYAFTKNNACDQQLEKGGAKSKLRDMITTNVSTDIVCNGPSTTGGANETLHTVNHKTRKEKINNDKTEDISTIKNIADRSLDNLRDQLTATSKSKKCRETKSRQKTPDEEKKVSEIVSPKTKGQDSPLSSYRSKQSSSPQFKTRKVKKCRPKTGKKRLYVEQDQVTKSQTNSDEKLEHDEEKPTKHTCTYMPNISTEDNDLNNLAANAEDDDDDDDEESRCSRSVEYDNISQTVIDPLPIDEKTSDVKLCDSKTNASSTIPDVVFSKTNKEDQSTLSKCQPLQKDKSRFVEYYEIFPSVANLLFPEGLVDNNYEEKIKSGKTPAKQNTRNNNCHGNVTYTANSIASSVHDDSNVQSMAANSSRASEDVEEITEIILEQSAPHKAAIDENHVTDAWKNVVTDDNDHSQPAENADSDNEENIDVDASDSVDVNTSTTTVELEQSESTAMRRYEKAKRADSYVYMKKRRKSSVSQQPPEIET